MLTILRSMKTVLRKPCRLLLTSPTPRVSSSSSKPFQTSPRSIWASHLLAGVLGGLTVVAGGESDGPSHLKGAYILLGYTWYHFSPYKPVIDTSRRFKIYAEDANKGVSIRFRGHVLELLRKTAKAYLAVIPGAEIFVDTAFDSLGDVLEKHGPEVERIAAKALDEIRKIAGDTENGLQAALKIMEVLRVRLVEIQALTKKIGDDLAPVAERAPEEIQLLAERLGPEAKRVVDERMAQVKTIVSQGASSSWENVKEQAARLSKSVGRSEEQPPANQSDKDHSPPTAHQEAAHKEESVSQDTTAK